MLKWKDEYSCNIAEIDTQHKKLFEIGERIYYAASVKDGFDHYDEILEVLNELTEYTVYHFKYEEDLFVKYNYPDYDSHKIEHDFFMKKVKKILSRDFDAGQYGIIIEIVDFVADWVAGHILKSDLAYKDYLNARGVI